MVFDLSSAGVGRRNDPVFLWGRLARRRAASNAAATLGISTRKQVSQELYVSADTYVPNVELIIIEDPVTVVRKEAKSLGGEVVPYVIGPRL